MVRGRVGARVRGRVGGVRVRAGVRGGGDGVGVEVAWRFHTLIDLSFEPEKSRGPESASARTREACPLRVCRQRIVFRSHT